MLAFLISAHTDPAQLRRLIQALDHEAHFFIHIDEKSDIAPFLKLCKAPNVHFLEHRINVRWGTILEVEYQMELLRAAINYPQSFSRLFFLSGLDYPLWSNQRIHQWVVQQGDSETLWAIDMDKPEINQSQRLLYATPRLLFRPLGNKWGAKASIACRKLCELVHWRRPLHFKVGGRQWHLYKGSAWMCISEELAGYVVDTYEQRPELRRYFSSSFGSAETLIPTIALNAPQWASRCRLFEGPYPGLDALTPLHFIIYQPVIRIMTLADLPTLQASGKMFTRKLMTGKSEPLIEALEQQRASSASGR